MIIDYRGNHAVLCDPGFIHRNKHKLLKSEAVRRLVADQTSCGFFCVCAQNITSVERRRRRRSHQRVRLSGCAKESGGLNLYISYCLQIPRKDENQQGHVHPNPYMSYSSEPLSSIVSFISMNTHAAVYSDWMSNTPSCCHKYSRWRQVWISPPLKTVPPSQIKRFLLFHETINTK